MDKVQAFISTATAWVNEHRKVSLVIACILVGFIWGAWARGIFAAPITCDLTSTTLICPVSAAPVPPQPPVVIPPAVNCPAGTVIYQGGGKDMVLTFTQGQFNVFRFTVPTTGASNRVLTSQFAPHLGGGTFAWSLSEKACDTSPANAVPLVGSSGIVYAGSKSAGASGNGWSFNMKASSDPTKGNVVPGKTYFVNVQATDCGNCGLIANVVVP